MVPEESDDWRGDGAKIRAEIPKLRAAVERTTLILEHWFYRGSRSPERTFWEDFEDLERCLETEVPAELLYFWQFDKTGTEDNVLAAGK